MKFAAAIGVSQRAVSWGEQSGNNVSGSTINSICRTYHINEKWLRTGAGEMYDTGGAFSLDRFVEEHGATELELEIVKAYFEMPQDLRRAVLAHFRDHFTGGAPESASEPQRFRG